jgi:hypothetical protein
MRVAPFHSVKAVAKPVYHNDNKCTEGNNIETQYKQSGTGGRPLCDHCARL